MGVTRKIAAILVADVVAYGGPAGAPRCDPSRLYPTTSVTRIAASLRVSPMAHPLSVTQNSTKASP